jgi:hypothetical protein
VLKHRDNRIARFVHDLQKTYDRARLAANEEFGLFELIENSITARYEGELVKREDPRRKYADTYAALDTGDIRNLLTTLWSGHISAETLDQVFETLTEDGIEKERWPYGYCDEDLAYERDQE